MWRRPLSTTLRARIRIHHTHCESARDVDWAPSSCCFASLQSFLRAEGSVTKDVAELTVPSDLNLSIMI
ncbi:uncharacterized protein ARMOST_11535 [Armillaria ostoyae]|uniref:Uncharacterized protein n=1 Tax=Armillaria ostoyae TaxID=47428 RepID=A0A284RHF1_ARMOS|nr:uncharacterized protein ARMOST_11535 [Armillaria ostoyae]